MLALAFMSAGCALDGYHEDLTAVHQGTPGCLDAACHPGFTSAGTVFRDLDGFEPAEGLEVVALDLGGGETQVGWSGATGLFYSEQALPQGSVAFRIGSEYSLVHSLPDQAECNLCHRPGGLEGAEGTLVGTDVFAPSLAGASPADGDQGVALDLELVLRFVEPLDPASISASTVRLDGPEGGVGLQIQALEGSPTVVLLPDRELSAGAEYRLTLERGLVDDAGNSLAAQVQLGFETASEGRPRVVGSEPAQGASEVGPDALLRLYVEPALDPSSVGEHSLVLSDSCDLAGFAADYDSELGAVELQPLLPLPGGLTCSLTVSDLVSADGAVQEGSWTLGFSTWPDGTAPSPLSRVPAPGSVGVSPDALVQLAFDEALDPATIADDALQVTTLDGELQAGSSALDETGRFLSWRSSQDLPAGELLLVELVAAAADAAGNPAVQPAPWSFRVGSAYDLSGPRALGLDPASGSVDLPVDVVLAVLLSEDPDLETVAGAISLQADGVVVPCWSSWLDGEDSVELVPLVPLQGSTLYDVIVDSSLLDLSGNALEEQGEFRFTTSSTGDAGGPIFEGVAAVDGLDVSTMLLSWSPAIDFETPASDIVYHAFLADTSGAQDFDAPSASSDPGAAELEVGDLEQASSWYVVVRAEDTDGNQDDNTVELLGSPMVSFSELVHPFVLALCSSCHGDSRAYGSLNIDHHDTFLESDSVVPYDSAASSFLTKGPHYGSAWFTDEQLTLLIIWIDQGALDN